MGGRHRRALWALVLLLAPPAGHAGNRLTAHRRQFRSKEYEEAAMLAMLSPLNGEASVGMFTNPTHGEKSLESSIVNYLLLNIKSYVKKNYVKKGIVTRTT
jgi:hypothetical protein